MDFCSFFIKDKALFGSFPTQDSVNELEKTGVKYFIDLTDNTKETRIISYKTNHTYINFPIKDNYIPNNWIIFSQFILKLCEIIKKLENNKIYLQCKGGNGRSGIVVSCM